MQVRAAGDAAARVLADVRGGGRQWRVLDLELRAAETRRVLEPVPAAAGGIFSLELTSQGGGVLVEQLDLLSEPNPPAAPLPARPNVVLFLVDALRADMLGAYGHQAPTSPRFDAFAREAVVFEHASAQSSWTRPSVASLLTGLGVEAHGVGGLTNLLVSQVTTLPETLQLAGYRTGALVANPVVSPALGFAQGFASWNDGPAIRHRRAADMIEPAFTWIERGGEPFFLYIHTLDPHKPYEPAPEHRKPFLFDDYRGSQNLSVLLSKKERSADELRFLRGAYQGEVHQNDAAFGAFLDGLAARGLLEQSLIVFTADHGEELFEHGSYGHGGTLYGEVLHIPLALRLPGPARRASRDALPVQHADVAPTVLGLVGAAAPTEMTGRDLSARCQGRPMAPQEPSLIVSRLTYAPADKVAARHGSLKLIVNQEAARGEQPRHELYDLDRDPGETLNLATERPLELRALRAQSAALLAAEAALRRRLGAGREAPIGAEQEEQLRALGYIR
jgi:arylsulfatase A-like enzyme